MKVFASDYLEIENGVYYSEAADEIFLLEERSFQIIPYRGRILTADAFTAYTYTVSTRGLDRQRNTTVNKDLKLTRIGDL